MIEKASLFSMEFFALIAPVIRVFLLIAAGFVFAHWKKSAFTQ